MTVEVSDVREDPGATLEDAFDALDPQEATAAWLAAFVAALEASDVETLERLFTTDGFWRDNLALTWGWHSVGGSREIANALASLEAAHKPHALALLPGFTPPARAESFEGPMIESFLEFETDVKKGRGVLRLVPDDRSPIGVSSTTLLTRIHDLVGELGRPWARHPGIGYERKDYPTQNWLERRADMLQRFETEDPDVLVIGAGQSGIALGAQLTQLGVSALLVERNERMGDSWRNRYDSLALHTPTDFSQTADIPFPDSFPTYLPKDVYANWLEFYADAMNVPAWTSTEFLSGSYDEAAELWTATVRRADGTERQMRPKLVVVATGGLGGTPRLATLPGLENFSGPVTHGAEFRSAKPYAGKNVLVVGVGTSAFDIALALHNESASVTMLQRGPTVVSTMENAGSFFSWYSDRSNSVEEKDLLFNANAIFRRTVAVAKHFTKVLAEDEKEMHQALEAAGLRLHSGEDGTGFFIVGMQSGGPYYFDVGAVDAIVSGGIKIAHTENLEGFDADGARMGDGSHLPFDAIVMCTGYHNLVEDARIFFGDDVADRLGLTYYLSEETGELTNSWCPTVQPGLTFMPGGTNQARFNSMPLALLLKAMLAGIAPLSSEHQTM